jgi:thiamine biosynthesis lipoprotein
MKMLKFRALKHLRFSCLFLILLLVFSGCEPGTKKVHFTGEAQGTYYAVTYYDEEGRNFQKEIDSLLTLFDKTASMWVPGSIISRINRGEQEVETNEWFRELFNLSKMIGDESNGAFDMTVGPLVNAWGFGLADRQELNESMVDSLTSLVDYRKVEMKDGRVIKGIPGMQFDFNGIAQGYSVDLVAELLQDHGIRTYLIDIGGEVLAEGKKPDGSLWTVGIERPAENAMSARSLEAIVGLENKAMATSGSYRKFYEKDGVRYSHTIDPSTGYPVTHTLLSVTVLAETCAVADGYATAFMVMGKEKSLKFLEHKTDLEAYFISSTESSGFEIEYTEGMEKILRE